MSVLNFGINSNWVRFGLMLMLYSQIWIYRRIISDSKEVIKPQEETCKVMCCICRKDFSRSDSLKKHQDTCGGDKEERKEIEVAIGSLVEHRVTITAPLSLLSYILGRRITVVCTSILYD